jgi:hypothetical protein
MEGVSEKGLRAMALGVSHDEYFLIDLNKHNYKDDTALVNYV